jgi:hypothetical protein
VNLIPYFIRNRLDLGMTAGKVQPTPGQPAPGASTPGQPGTPKIAGTGTPKPGAIIGTLASDGPGIIHCKCAHAFFFVSFSLEQNQTSTLISFYKA